MSKQKEAQELDIKLPWKSEIDPHYSLSFFTFVLFGSIFAALPFLIIYLLTLVSNPATRLGIPIAAGIFSPFLFSLSILFFWISIKFRVHYLEIYEDCIKYRTPMTPLKQKEIPYEEVLDLSLGDMPWYYGSYNPYRASPSARLHIGFKKIVVYFKNSKPFQISGAWVYDLQTAFSLIESKIKRPDRSVTCEYCFSKKMRRRCDSCGIAVCSDCIENYECLTCRLSRHHKRAIMSLGCAFIPPLILILWLLAENTPLFFTFLDAKGNLFAIYYFISNLVIGPLGLSYGLGIWLSEFRLLKKIKQTKGTVKYKGFRIISFSAIVILIFKALYIIQFINLMRMDFTVALIVELILDVVFIYISFKMNKK